MMFKKPLDHDRIFYKLMDKESGAVRSLAEDLYLTLKSYHTSNKAVVAFMNQLHVVSTVEISELAPSLERTNLLLQKMNVEMTEHPQLMEKIGILSINQLTQKIKLFAESCIELFNKAAKIEETTEI